jgi:3-oxoacyl-[acyl-carrier-protein] synthase II
MDQTLEHIEKKLVQYFKLGKNVLLEGKHGTGKTSLIQKVFGEHAYNLNISSTKSMTGHLLGAAGAIEALACVFAVQNDVIPPTINHFNDDPALDNKLNLTFNKAQKRVVRAALSNTFGFGGHNASVIVKKYPA